ncbi:hypothetical protein SUGI_0661870 [Cryptomeria japonica]|nr:hypothetical protein SUGI_0661870 [Cryptomeria japonica]
MDQKSSTKKHTRSTRKEKPLVSKTSPTSHKKKQSVLGFPCKKPVRLNPILFPKSCSHAKYLVYIPAKIPPSLDFLPPERKYITPSSVAKSKGKRVAKSLKDVIEDVKKLQANNHSEKASLHEAEEDQDQDLGSVQIEANTPKAADFKIPEKYSGLAEFFDAMEAAIRLLRLRKTISTFGNICPQVEAMTHRQFMHAHVAQMKFILPEGLLLEKILVHDEKTLCMKADLKISLLRDALNSVKERQVFGFASKVNTSNLRKTFHTRLVEFVQSHPEGDDVPEGMLPEPFNKKCQLTPATNPPPVHEEDVASSNMSSLFPKSFQLHFSKRILTEQSSLNLSCILDQDQNLKPSDIPKAGKPDGFNAAVTRSANSHFPAGFKSSFAAKFHQTEVSEISNDLKKPSKVHEREVKNLDGRLGGSAAKSHQQQMLACLPKLFNMICDIFHSSKRSVLTQEELIHKIISNHCDVTDRSEVEEQLLLLRELVPEWISGRTATSGDFIYSIKSNIDLRTTLSKLVLSTNNKNQAGKAPG